jgi:hypothetical protein
MIEIRVEGGRARAVRDSAQRRVAVFRPHRPWRGVVQQRGNNSGDEPEEGEMR